MQATDGGRCRQIPQHDPQRVTRPELVVAVGDDHECAGGGDASADEAQEIERRLVSPVGVFDDHQRGSSAAREECMEDQEGALAMVVQFEDTPELLSCLRRDVEESPERPRRRERVAGAVIEPSLALHHSVKRCDQGGLTHPGFPRDEDQVSGPRSGCIEPLA